MINFKKQNGTRAAYVTSQYKFKDKMRQIFLLIILVCVTACGHSRTSFIELGKTDTKKYWVYLCGLTHSFDSPQEQENRKILNEIGHELNIGFIALMPRDRCQKFDNKMCWPHKDCKQVAQTFQSILIDLNNKEIRGWIGFSNGGYFLQELVQQYSLTDPLITIGAAGNLDPKYQVYNLIGTQDTYAYKRSKILKSRIIEYVGGHAIDKNSLQKVLSQVHSRITNG